MKPKAFKISIAVLWRILRSVSNANNVFMEVFFIFHIRSNTKTKAGCYGEKLFTEHKRKQLNLQRLVQSYSSYFINDCNLSKMTNTKWHRTVVYYYSLHTYTNKHFVLCS